MIVINFSCSSLVQLTLTLGQMWCIGFLCHLCTTGYLVVYFSLLYISNFFFVISGTIYIDRLGSNKNYCTKECQIVLSEWQTSCLQDGIVVKLEGSFVPLKVANAKPSLVYIKNKLFNPAFSWRAEIKPEDVLSNDEASRRLNTLGKW